MNAIAKLFAKSATETANNTRQNRDAKGKFVAGNTYRMVKVTRSVDGIGYTRMISPTSGKTVCYRRTLQIGNSR